MGNTSFSSGFQTGYAITSSWKARKEAKDKIKKQEDESKAFALDLGKRFDRDRRSGTGISQEEYENGYSFAMAAGTESLNMYKDLYLNSMNMTKKELDENLAEYKLMEEMYADVDFKDYDTMTEIMKTWKSPKAKQYAEVLMKKWKTQEKEMAEDKAKEPEYFTSLPDVKKKYGEEAQGQFAQGKGWIYTGEEKKTPKSSDYINAINTLGAVAKSKTEEEFQAFKVNYETETGINLGKISRVDLLEVEPDEIKKANFDTVFFGARGIMTEYSESAEALDDEAKREILTKWKLRRPLMNNKDQQRGDAYMAEIGIDMNMPDEPEIEDEVVEDKWYSMENILKFVKDWDAELSVGAKAPLKRRGE